MRHALGRGPPRTPPCTAIGRARVKCRVAYDALVAPSLLADGSELDGLTSQELLRPAPLPAAPASPPALERPLAGRITPAKVAGLSAVLRLPATRVEAILQASPPAVHTLEPSDVARRMQQLCAALGLRPKQAAFMVTKQPAYMLLTPVDDIRAKVGELATALGVPPGAVLRTALTVPSILVRRVPTVQRRVEAYTSLLDCTPLDVLQVLARGPEYLSDTPSSVRQRMVALGYVLRRPKCTIAAMLQTRPDLVSMSFRVMNTKLNGLMCIMNKKKRLIVELVVKAPALMRCDLDRARYVFEGLQALLRKRDGFVYAMVCHAPHLLLVTPRGIHQRCAALQRCLSGASEWQEQYQQLRPPGVAQLLLNSRRSLSVMMYLYDRGRQGTVPLEKLLDRSNGGGPEQALGPLWPGFQAWMSRRQQYAALRAQQRRAVSQQGTRAAAAGLVAPEQAVRHPVAAPPVQHHAVQVQQRAPQQRLWDVASYARSSSGDALEAAEHHVMRHDPQQPACRVPLADKAPSTQDAGDALQAAASSSGSCNSSGTTSAVGAERHAQLGESASRQQQPGASTSGRQPSWLQLRAQYLRSRQRQRADMGAAPAADGALTAPVSMGAASQRLSQRDQEAASEAADRADNRAGPQGRAARRGATTKIGGRHARRLRKHITDHAHAGSNSGSAPVAVANEAPSAGGDVEPCALPGAHTAVEPATKLPAGATGNASGVLWGAAGTGRASAGPGQPAGIPVDRHVQQFEPQQPPRHVLAGLLRQGAHRQRAHPSQGSGSSPVDPGAAADTALGSHTLWRLETEAASLPDLADGQPHHTSAVPSIQPEVAPAAAMPGTNMLHSWDPDANGTTGLLPDLHGSVEGQPRHSAWLPLETGSCAHGNGLGSNGHGPFGAAGPLLAPQLQQQQQSPPQRKERHEGFCLLASEGAVDVVGSHQDAAAGLVVVGGQGCGLQDVGREARPAARKQQRQDDGRTNGVGAGPGQGQGQELIVESAVGVTVPR